MAAPEILVRRVDFGYFVRPAVETTTGRDRVEPVLGYLVDHPAGVLLLDTGMGPSPEVDRHYRPRRRPLPAALAAVGSQVDDITVVVNCHLHFDHCGNNPALPRRPVFVQSVELAAARERQDYTLPELVDAPDLAYEPVTGEAEIWDGVRIVPTPGHTDGHQSVLLRRRDGTVVVLAGQSHDSASDFGSDVLALRAAGDGYAELPVPPAWMRRLQGMDPARVYFAHDQAVWVPS